MLHQGICMTTIPFKWYNASNIPTVDGPCSCPKAILINPTHPLIQSKKAQLHNYKYMYLSWDRVVCIMTVLEAERSGFRLPAEARDLSLLQHVQTCSENHAASYSIGAGSFFIGSKAAGAWDWLSSLSRAPVKNEWRYTATPRSVNSLTILPLGTLTGSLNISSLNKQINTTELKDCCIDWATESPHYSNFTHLATLHSDLHWRLPRWFPHKNRNKFCWIYTADINH